MPSPRWLALLLAVLLTGCGKPHPVDAHPALWRVADKDTTIWLFGSIHALPPGVRWQTPALAHAIAAADTLILEVLPADAEAARDEFLSVAQRDGLPPLRARVAAADRGLLDRGVARAGLAPQSLDRLKTWAAALTIGAAAGRQEAASAADGVEPVLTARFAGRAIGALETRAGQFAAFDRLPAASQRFLLLQAAAEARDPARGYARLLTAWATGDAAALAATLDPLRRDPAIMTALVTGRNARWASAITRRMARPGRVFLAVGAGHLVGGDSVVAMLRARGLQVTRVE
ncbi:TraB/GumN family protein [Sphingomonas sp.]|uniref:TraB/GumN family protein n=1 Tax=Sphingomonas sp. TaxID=28214 RepID=UPI00333FAE4C